MKRIYNTVLAIFITATILAQVPQLLSYQAVIRNNSDQLIVNKQIGMKISILQTTANGTAVYTETQTPTTNQNGLVSIQIGGANGFSNINWSNGPYFIKTETDITGGTNYTITGTSQLLSVPYALAAGSLAITKGASTFDTYMKDDGTFIGLPRISVQQPFDSIPSVTDIDGNVYATVKIGTQVWLTSNLKTTHYSNGDSIPNVTSNTAWATLTTGAQCTYNNIVNVDSINLFGRLYNFYAVADSRGIAPIGWHVATDAEWTNLIKYLGTMAAARLKETGLVHWAPNFDALNDTKFSAVSTGARTSYQGNFYNIRGRTGSWWSSTETGQSLALYRYIDSDNNSGNRSLEKSNGYTVRCIKD